MAMGTVFPPRDPRQHSHSIHNTRNTRNTHIIPARMILTDPSHLRNYRLTPCASSTLKPRGYARLTLAMLLQLMVGILQIEGARLQTDHILQSKTSHGLANPVLVRQMRLLKRCCKYPPSRLLLRMKINSTPRMAHKLLETEDSPLLRPSLT